MEDAIKTPLHGIRDSLEQINQSLCTLIVAVEKGNIRWVVVRNIEEERIKIKKKFAGNIIVRTIKNPKFDKNKNPFAGNITGNISCLREFLIPNFMVSIKRLNQGLQYVNCHIQFN